MAENRRSDRPRKNPQQSQSETPQQRKARMNREYTEKKLERAASPEYDVVSRRALDTSEFITLINYNDNVVSQMRRLSGPGRRLTMTAADSFLVRGNILKALLSEHNAEMCAAMGWKYVPPRGLDRLLEDLTKDQLDTFYRDFTRKIESLYPAEPQQKTAPTSKASAQAATA